MLEDDVLKLKVSMDDASRVAVINAVANLHNDLSRLHFIKHSFLLQITEQLTASCKLHNHDQLFLFNERVIQLDDVFVPQSLKIQGFFEN